MTGFLSKISFLEIFFLFYFQIISIMILMLTLFHSIVRHRLSKGQSQLEHSRNSEDCTYDLGFDRNWEMAFGRGREFKTSHQILQPLYYVINRVEWMFVYVLEPKRDLAQEMKHFYNIDIVDTPHSSP